jgi:hypothetical protein
MMLIMIKIVIFNVVGASDPLKRPSRRVDFDTKIAYIFTSEVSVETGTNVTI